MQPLFMQLNVKPIDLSFIVVTTIIQNKPEFCTCSLRTGFMKATLQ